MHVADADARRRHGTVVLLVVTAALGLAPVSARADPPLGLTDCVPAQGARQCSGLVSSWDGVPLDVTVTFPDASRAPFPLVVELNGFGNSKWEYLDPASKAYTDNAYDWARDGYAVLTYTARGLWGSCGTPESRAANPVACARGYIHLADVRYEARDAQHLIGRLVDDGFVQAGRIGVTGDSYGGGQTMELAALRDRMVEPDGRVVPWRSPQGRPLSLAAAAPVIPWTDLVYAIAPNGRTFANAVPGPTADFDPVGVFKASFANAIFAAAQFATGPGQPVGESFVPGRPMGFLAPPGTDPDADVAGWVERADQGEPYDDASARAIVDRLERYHDAYYLDSSHAPPPLFVGAGFTDDLFPVDETLRFVNRTRREHPGTPIRLLFGDFGHQRASNKADVRDRLIREIHAWFDHYVRDAAPAPRDQVVAMTQTCPRDAPSGGPFVARTFAGLARGEVRYATGVAQTIDAHGGDPSVAAAIDPAAGGGNACATTGTAPEPGTASYALPAAGARGYTLLGAPAVTARLVVSGTPPSQAEVAARLWDVAPGSGSQTLVARSLYRPTGGRTDVWELHANGWRFAPGHVPKLELLGSDAPYGRPSNGTFTVEVRSLQLRLPVRERIGRAPARRRPAPRLTLRTRCARRGLVATVGARNARIRRATFYVGNHRVATDRRPPFASRVLRRTRRRGRVRVTVRALLRGGRTLRASRVVRRCARR